MTPRVELRVSRWMDGTVAVEAYEFDDAGNVVNRVPWDRCWFHDFLGGSKSELASWLKDQLVNTFNAGYFGALNAGWMAETTTMEEKEPRCQEPALAETSNSPT